MNVHVRYARIVTPQYTYQKYTFTADAGAQTVSVINPRTHETMNVLTSATVTELGPRFFTAEGLNPAGEHVIWRADDQGCGCRVSSRIFDTDPSDIPT